MRKLFGVAAALITVASLSGMDRVEQYADAVGRQLGRYPASTLRDIYKSFFQDRFGPGHLIGDTAAARRYLHRELMEMDGPDSLPRFEPAGLGDQYYRVNLSVVKDGSITEDEFFAAFIESASGIVFPSVEQWTTEWNIIRATVPDSVDGYSADSMLIDSLLSTGNYVFHHSRRFNETYRPHYRIISKAVFESRLKARLTEHINDRVAH